MKDKPTVKKPENMSEEEWNDYLSDMYDDFKAQEPSEHEEAS